VERAGLQSRIHLLVKDIAQLASTPDCLRDVDAVTVFFVFHEILSAGPDRLIALLQNFRRLFPSVPLIVFEVIRPTAQERRKKPGMAVQYTLQHDLSNQRLVDRNGWHKMFKGAGFDSVEERYIHFARTAIYKLR
jgi:hypothetical protein